MNKSMEKYSRLQWSNQVKIHDIQQQQHLKSLKQQKNLKSWKQIAQLMNSAFPDKNRTGKQCRERYMNYVRFNEQEPRILTWDASDDLALLENFLEYGAKWVEISHRMEGRQFFSGFRSENSLKNRFYGALRRVVRKINRVQKQKKFKCKKLIKYDSLIKVLSFKSSEEFQSDQAQSGSKQRLVETLQRAIVQMIVKQNEAITTDEIVSVITDLHQLYSLSKSSQQKHIPTVNQSSFESKLKIVPELTSTKLEDQLQLRDHRNVDVSGQEGRQEERQESQPEQIMQIINENSFYKNSPKSFDQEICELPGLQYSSDEYLNSM